MFPITPAIVAFKPSSSASSSFPFYFGLFSSFSSWSAELREAWANLREVCGLKVIWLESYSSTCSWFLEKAVVSSLVPSAE